MPTPVHLTGSVENGHFCLRLVAGVGLPPRKQQTESGPDIVETSA